MAGPRPGIFDSTWFDHNKQAVERANDDNRPDYELWQRVDATGGAYHWMVWRVGPMHGEDAEWFEDEHAARARYSELMGEA